MEDFPPGFRFYPTEDELVSFYLYNKLHGKREDLNRVMDKIIPVLDIYEFDPSNLPHISNELCSIRDTEQWFFFVPRQESEARGGRPKRLTADGYWKATGSPSNVFSQNRCIGGKRTMVFYRGRAPNGTKTDWKMNEYSLALQEDQPSSSAGANTKTIRHEFSLCRVYNKSKCVRSYDRRPVNVDHDHHPIVPEGHQTHQSQTLFQQHVHVDERHTIITPSQVDQDPTSSSSGDQFGVRNIDSTNMEFSNSEETFLNWDQFDCWFPDDENVNYFNC